MRHPLQQRRHPLQQRNQESLLTFFPKNWSLRVVQICGKLGSFIIAFKKGWECIIFQKARDQRVWLIWNGWIYIETFKNVTRNILTGFCSRWSEWITIFKDPVLMNTRVLPLIKTCRSWGSSIETLKNVSKSCSQMGWGVLKRALLSNHEVVVESNRSNWSGIVGQERNNSSKWAPFLIIMVYYNLHLWSFVLCWVSLGLVKFKLT